MLKLINTKTLSDQNKINQSDNTNLRKQLSSKYIAMLVLLTTLSGCTNLTGRLKTESNKSIYLEEIVVEIQGAVNAPGTYSLPKKASIRELVGLANGLQEKADTSGLNMNQTLSHHDIVVIDEVKEVVKISINTASLEQLQQLPGIGLKTAQSIIEYRETNGLFQTLNELDHVKGIGAKKLEKLRDYVKL